MRALEQGPVRERDADDASVLGALWPALSLAVMGVALLCAFTLMPKPDRPSLVIASSAATPSQLLARVINAGGKPMSLKTNGRTAVARFPERPSLTAMLRHGILVVDGSPNGGCFAGVAQNQ